MGLKWYLSGEKHGLGLHLPSCLPLSTSKAREMPQDGGDWVRRHSVGMIYVKDRRTAEGCLAATEMSAGCRFDGAWMLSWSQEAAGRLKLMSVRYPLRQFPTPDAYSIRTRVGLRILSSYTTLTKSGFEP